MKIKIISVGKVKDREIRAKIDDYIARIRHDASVELVWVKDSNIKTEGIKIHNLLKKEAGVVIVLSEEGTGRTSKTFAQKFLRDTGSATFILGGPYGLDTAVKDRADHILSLSKMTFPHEMALLFLTEQIYRGLSINLNRNYHKD